MKTENSFEDVISKIDNISDRCRKTIIHFYQKQGKNLKFLRMEKIFLNDDVDFYRFFFLDAKYHLVYTIDYDNIDKKEKEDILQIKKTNVLMYLIERLIETIVNPLKELISLIFKKGGK